MTQYKLKMEDFAFWEIDQVQKLLKAYIETRNDDVWLKTIVWENTEPIVYMVDDKGDQYVERKGELVLRKEEQ